MARGAGPDATSRREESCHRRVRPPHGLDDLVRFFPSPKNCQMRTRVSLRESRAGHRHLLAGIESNRLVTEVCDVSLRSPHFRTRPSVTPTPGSTSSRMWPSTKRTRSSRMAKVSPAPRRRPPHGRTRGWWWPGTQAVPGSCPQGWPPANGPRTRSIVFPSRLNSRAKGLVVARRRGPFGPLLHCGSPGRSDIPAVDGIRRWPPPWPRSPRARPPVGHRRS